MEDGSHLLELLETLEAGALLLERKGDGDSAASIHRLFQSAHNLKSGLAMAGLARASKLFHGLEDGLDDIRRGRLSWSSGWADAVLETVDRIRPCLESGGDDQLDPTFIAPVGAAATGHLASPQSPEEREAALRAASCGQCLYRIEKLFSPGLGQEEFEGHLILEDIRDNGTLVSVRPEWLEYSKSESEVIVRFLFHSTQTGVELGQLFFDPLIEIAVPAAEAPRFRILVIDADPLVAKVVTDGLSDLGQVTLAGDGASGAEHFHRALNERKAFDVVILDLEMPGIDGHTTLQEIREEEQVRDIQGLDRCLVFINTSNTDFADVRKSFRLQADRYFLKPLSVQKIKKKLEESLTWLENRRKGRE